MGIRQETIEDVYYVDGVAGLDTNAGTTVAASFKTIATALDAADDDYTDDAMTSIYIKPGEYEEDDLLFAGHGLRLIGLGVPGRDSGVHVVAPDNASAYGSIALAAANVEIANICFEMGASAQPVLYAVAMDNCWIHDCTFYCDSVPTNVCCVEAHDIRNTVIEKNKFFGGKTYGWYGISGADTYFIESIIRDNLFAGSSVGGYGSGAKAIYIHTDQTVYGSVIENNKILMAAVAGSPIGIDIDAHTDDRCGLMINDNYVLVPSGKTPIETAFAVPGMLHNHTAAGTTIVDPNPVVT